MVIGETRVDPLHLLEDLRDVYPGSPEETIVTEIAVNSLTFCVTVPEDNVRLYRFVFVDQPRFDKRAPGMFAALAAGVTEHESEPLSAPATLCRTARVAHADGVVLPRSGRGARQESALLSYLQCRQTRRGA